MACIHSLSRFIVTSLYAPHPLHPRQDFSLVRFCTGAVLFDPAGGAHLCLAGPRHSPLLVSHRAGNLCTVNQVRVGVLCGGSSAEREVSLRSGRGVHRALRAKGWDAELIEIDTFDGLPQRLRPYPVVFNILHGGPGEDGTVQLLLDLMGKAYVGSGPLASALAMDKVESRKLFSGKGLPVPSWLVHSSGDLDAFLARAEGLGFPLVLKPRREGSSVGLHVVESAESLRAAACELKAQFGEFLVEAYIPGRELTVGVLERQTQPEALPIVELRPKGREVFDWKAKYTPGECEFLCPAPLSPEESARVQEVALQAHKLLGCLDFSRADIRLDPHGTPYILEVNTLPGMTEMSTLPRAAQAAGLSYEDLVDGLVRRALARLASTPAVG